MLKRPPLICVFFEEGRRIVCEQMVSTPRIGHLFLSPAAPKSMHRDSKWEHEAARGGRVKNNKAYDKGKDGVPPDVFL